MQAPFLPALPLLDHPPTFFLPFLVLDIILFSFAPFTPLSLCPLACLLLLPCPVGERWEPTSLSTSTLLTTRACRKSRGSFRSQVGSELSNCLPFLSLFLDISCRYFIVYSGLQACPSSRVRRKSITGRIVIACRKGTFERK